MQGRARLRRQATANNRQMYRAFIPWSGSTGLNRSSQARSSRKYAWPRSYADNTHGDALWALLERARRRVATGAAGSGTFGKQMLTSRQMPCQQAASACWGVPKRSLTGRRQAPGAPAPQEDDPGRCEAQLDPLDAVPALLPAGVVADFGVEPDAWTFWLEHPFVGRVVLRIMQRRAACAAVDGVARAERLHRRRARPQGAGDPLVAAVLLNPTVDVIYELPERNPLIYSHAPHRPLFCGSRLRRWLRPPLRHPSGGRGSSPLPFLLGTRKHM